MPEDPQELQRQMSADRDFDRFAGITRLDPLEWFEKAGPWR